MDKHSKSIQSLQPTRERIYEKESFYDVSPPEGLPNWAYYSNGEEEEKSAVKPKRRKTTEYEGLEEEHQTGESAQMGEIRGAIAKAKPVGKKSTKKGKKAAQSGKFRKTGRMKSIKGKGKEVEEEEEEEEEEETEDIE